MENLNNHPGYTTIITSRSLLRKITLVSTLNDRGLYYYSYLIIGHIYCITEGGGAVEEGRCPECASTIGGRNHRLRDDNQLAGDVDGARYAAFSDMANVRNFDLRQFRF